MYPPVDRRRAHAEHGARFRAGKKMFPQLLREAGYYCTNNVKEDYNLAKPGKVWDDVVGEGPLGEPRGRPAVLRRLQFGQEP